MRERRVWILYAITLFVFRFSGLDNLYGAVTLVENGEARARIYHAPLAQEPHARNHEDDPDTWTRGSPRIFSRDLSEAEREEMTEDMQERPFRVLPGGIHQYLD